MKTKLKTTQITKISLMVAFISALSYLKIPLPFTEIAITGQTLAVNLIALVLSPGEAFITMLCYWILGFIGVPVYGGPAGPAKMFGPAGGYFIAFILVVVLIAKWKGKKYNFIRYSLVTIFIGVILINTIGSVWMKVITGMTWKAAFLAGFVPFILLDVLKCIIAVILAKPIQMVFMMLSDSDNTNRSMEQKIGKDVNKHVGQHRIK